MATGQIFEISKNIAKGYRIPDARPVRLNPNGAGVIALMGIYNGTGAAKAAKRRLKDQQETEGKKMAVRRARGKAKKKAKRAKRRSGMGFARSFFIVKKGRKLHATARRNADDFDSSDFSSSDELVSNRRRSRKKSRKGKARRRKMTAKQLKYFGPRKARKGRKVARKSSKARTYFARKSVSATRAKKGIKVLLKNVAQANRDAAKLRAELSQLTQRAKSEKDAAKRAAYLQRAAAVRATLQAQSVSAGARLPPWYSTTWGGLTPPWYHEKVKVRRPQKPKYGPFAAQAALKGLTPRELAAAFHGLSDAKARQMFGSSARYQAWLQAMMLSPTFRKYAKSSRGHLGMPQWLGTTGGKKRKAKKSKARKHAKRHVRRAASRKHPKMTWKKMVKKYGGPKKAASHWRKFKKSHHKGRKARRNFGYSPNLAFGSIKETLMTGLVGLASFIATKLVGGLAGKYLPLGQYAPLAGNVLAGGLVIYGSDKVFADPDKARASTVAATLSILHAVGKQFLGGMLPSAFGAIPDASQQPRYHLNGMGAPIYQANAGFGAPLYEATAGLGEYMQASAGMGEYVAADGGLQPVSDFGEYVATNLSVEGFGDYEVAPGFGTADGMGLINDGVRPDGNLSRELDIIEAAAGFGATGIQGQSRYIPDQGAATVGRTEGTSDTGIFDVGGANGILS